MRSCIPPSKAPACCHARTPHSPMPQAPCLVQRPCSPVCTRRFRLMPALAGCMCPPPCAVQAALHPGWHAHGLPRASSLPPLNRPCPGILPLCMLRIRHAMIRLVLQASQVMCLDAAARVMPMPGGGAPPLQGVAPTSSAPRTLLVRDAIPRARARAGLTWSRDRLT